MLRAFSGDIVEIENISEANDTRILQRLLSASSGEYNAEDAGTSFRFFCTWLALSGKQAILTGTHRMCERPIGILVETLRELGSDIQYEGKEGYPPLSFKGYKPTGVNTIRMNPSVSSQYTSSLMMAAPTLPHGLEINMDSGEVSSLPYLWLTWQMMQHCGIDGFFSEKRIYIPQQPYKKAILKIETDWTAVGYWVAIAALAGNTNLWIANLKSDSWQGDRVVAEIARPWGVNTAFRNGGLLIQNQSPKRPPSFQYNFINHPDLAQTFIVLCAATGTEAWLHGLASLAIKETNRLAALKVELTKVGVCLEVDTEAGTCYLPKNQLVNTPTLPFQTYGDHRMAMSLSLFSLCFPVEIQDAEVVVKSYPGYWQALASVGFGVETTTG